MIYAYKNKNSLYTYNSIDVMAGLGSTHTYSAMQNTVYKDMSALGKVYHNVGIDSISYKNGKITNISDNYGILNNSNDAIFIITCKPSISGESDVDTIYSNCDGKSTTKIQYVLSDILKYNKETKYSGGTSNKSTSNMLGHKVYRYGCGGAASYMANGANGLGSDDSPKYSTNQPNDGRPSDCYKNGTRGSGGAGSILRINKSGEIMKYGKTMGGSGFFMVNYD